MASINIRACFCSSTWLMMVRDKEISSVEGISLSRSRMIRGWNCWVSDLYATTKARSAPSKILKINSMILANNLSRSVIAPRAILTCTMACMRLTSSLFTAASSDTWSRSCSRICEASTIMLTPGCLSSSDNTCNSLVPERADFAGNRSNSSISEVSAGETGKRITAWVLPKYTSSPSFRASGSPGFRNLPCNSVPLVDCRSSTKYPSPSLKMRR